MKKHAECASLTLALPLYVMTLKRADWKGDMCLDHPIPEATIFFIHIT
jgi:hypothetical protein